MYLKEQNSEKVNKLYFNLNKLEKKYEKYDFKNEAHIRFHIIFFINTCFMGKYGLIFYFRNIIYICIVNLYNF